MITNKAVIDHINDLKIIRPNLNSMSIKESEEIFNFIEKQVNREDAPFVNELFKETLSSNPELKILNYYIALTKFYFQPEDPLEGDQAMETFFHDLQQSQKTSLADYLSEQLGERFRSSFLWEYQAKRLKQTLANTSSVNQEDRNRVHNKLIEVLFKIHRIRVDDNEATESLADQLANSSNEDEVFQAFFYYQTIFNRIVQHNDSREIVRLWKKILKHKNLKNLLDASEESFRQLLSTLNHITAINDKKTKEEIFLEITQLKKVRELPNLIKIFKMALANDVLIPEYSKTLGEEWENYYGGNPHFVLFQKLSGLKKTLFNKDPLDGINCQRLLKEVEEFEKLVNLTPQVMVSHHNFGIGVIKEITLPPKQPNESNVFITIDFEAKKKHSMSIRIAANSLEILYPHHLKGIQIFFPERIAEILKSDNETLFRHILLTFKEPVSLKEIKTLMVPGIMDEEEWKERWKVIRKEIPEMTTVRVKNNLYAYDENTRIKNDNENKNWVETVTRLSDMSEKLKFIESTIQHLPQDKETEKSEISQVTESLISQSLNSNKDSLRDYLPAMLAIAARIINVNELDLEKTKSFLKNTDSRQSSLAKSLILLQYSNTKIAFIKNLEKFYSIEEMPETISIMLNGLNGAQKDLILDYLVQIYGQSIITRVFEIIDKEYLTAIDTFISLAKLDISRSLNIYPGNRTLFLNKLIKCLHQSHLNVEINKDRSAAKKNFNTLYRILFEDRYLFKHLETDLEASLEERINILENLEQKPYLDKDIKQEMKTFHATLTKTNQG